MENNKIYDVIILGSSISGSMLAAILASKKLNVLLIDAETHPRFAIGEATTPDTSCKFKLLALKYNVPEIANLATFYKLHTRVSAACGVKRSFSFLYHREEEEQNPQESHQFPTLSPPLGPDCHFFRQDTDAYMFSVALQYGAEVRQKVMISDIAFDEEEVTLTDNKGVQYQGKYLVDASGYKSILAEKLGLRDSPEKLKTNSRAIFTHMIHVQAYDQIGGNVKDYGLHYPLSQSTLHHVFEGGWFWIIPFNNYRDAVNPLCSVGLLLNRELYPEKGMDAEEEFFYFVNKFPKIREQLKEAKAVRNWVSTGRIQYCSKNSTGHRYCLMAHAAGFIDPLFSSGLNLTASVIDLLTESLIDAFNTQDFSVEKFRSVDQFFQKSLKHYDEVVANSFTAFKDYDLWDAWYRVWVAGNFVGTALNTNLYFKYLDTGDKGYLHKTKEIPYFGVLGQEFAEHQEVFTKASQEIGQVQQGKKTPAEAAKSIRSLFKPVKYMPSYYRWHDEKVRTTPTFTFFQSLKLYFWYYFHAPAHIRRVLFSWSFSKAIMYVFESIRNNNVIYSRKKRFYFRDVFKAWNRDWTYK